MLQSIEETENQGLSQCGISVFLFLQTGERCSLQIIKSMNGWFCPECSDLLVYGKEEEEDGWDLGEPVNEEAEVAISGEHRNRQTQRHVHDVVCKPVTFQRKLKI